MIKALFFDLFFTLSDPHGELETDEWKALGITARDYADIVWETAFASDRGNGLYRTCDEILEHIISCLGFPVTAAQRSALHEAKANRMRMALTDLPAGILPTIENLKAAGYKLGLISNADAYDILYWRESPLCRFMDMAVFSCQMGVSKPDKRIYQYAMEALNVKPSEAVFVGDGGSDEMYGARQCGMRTVWTEQLIKWGIPERKRISRFADHHVLSISDIPAWLTNQQ